MFSKTGFLTEEDELKVTDMVRKVLDANAIETPQWGVVKLKGVPAIDLTQTQRLQAIHKLGELVWRETVTIEVKGKEISPEIEAEVRVGKTNVNAEMRKFLLLNKGAK